MSKENENFESQERIFFDTTDIDTDTVFKVITPLEMIWQPKEDITTYELAMCIPYLVRSYSIMPYEIDKSLPHFRHFVIIDHNVY